METVTTAWREYSDAKNRYLYVDTLEAREALSFYRDAFSDAQDKFRAASASRDRAYIAAILNNTATPTSAGRADNKGV